MTPEEIVDRAVTVYAKTFGSYPPPLYDAPLSFAEVAERILNACKSGTPLQSWEGAPNKPQRLTTGSNFNETQPPLASRGHQKAAKRGLNSDSEYVDFV